MGAVFQMAKLLKAFGKEQTLAAWAREYDFIYQSLRYRINVMDYTLEQALVTNKHIRHLRTHCKNGHKYTNENTYIYARGRACRTCLNRSLKNWSVNNKEKVRANANKQNYRRAVMHLPKKLQKSALVLNKLKRALTKLEHKGSKKTIGELAKVANVTRQAIHRRIYERGMTIEEAISYEHVKKYKAFGKVQTLSKWASEFGINLVTLRSRIKRYNFTLEEALTTPLRGL